MDSRLYNIVNYRFRDVNRILKEKYTASFMSNTKWIKVLTTLTNTCDPIFLRYKLIYDDVITESVFDMVDATPYFIEPIMYKEVEWIEFPKEYENWVNGNNLKAGKKQIKQDLEKIKQELGRLGKFDLEFYDGNIRLYGYK